MLPDDVIGAIDERLGERFERDEGHQFASDILALCPHALGQPRVLRLRRTCRDSAGWRTLLFAILTGDDSYRDALRWASDVRQMLPDPDSSDLYLFLFLSEPVVNRFDAETIEANEHFCRKMVARNDESVDDFLDRTFLARAAFLAPITASLGDPLSAALFDVVQQQRLHEHTAQCWRSVLASGATGGKDLADRLRDAWSELEHEDGRR